MAAATFGLLAYTNSQPHVSSLAEEGDTPSCSSDSSSLSADQAKANTSAKFPSAEVADFRTITQDTKALVEQGDAAGATSRITDLETAWDDAESSLSAKDCATWTYVDEEIDAALSAVRDPQPRPADRGRRARHPARHPGLTATSRRGAHGDKGAPPTGTRPAATSSTTSAAAVACARRSDTRTST